MLLFAAGEDGDVFADDGVKALRHDHDIIIVAGLPGGGLHFLPGGVHAANKERL